MGLGKGNSFVEVAALLPQLELASSITLVLANFEHGDNHCLYRQRRRCFGLCSRFRVGSAGSGYGQ